MSLKKYVTILGIGSFLLLFACNIFEPKEVDPSKYYMTGQAWVIEGMKKMWDKDWVGAYGDFNRAITLDSSLSEAYFYRGKCWLRIFQVDLTQVWDEVKPDESNAVPFLFKPNKDYKLMTDPLKQGTFTIWLTDTLLSQADFKYTKQDIQYTASTLCDSVFLQRKRIYDAIAGAVKDLEMIIYYDAIHDSIGQPNKELDHVITRRQYESDYLIEISIRTILGILDINKNNKLDFNTKAGDLDERKSFRILCNDISSLDDMQFDSLKTISKDPRKMKENLDSILQVLKKAEESYNKFHKELIDGAKKDPSLDSTMADDIGDMIHNFNTILPYYYYDDWADNDSDSYDSDSNGVHDRMIWINWDDNATKKDSLIDIYSQAQIAGGKPHIHIGDSVARTLNPEYYQWVTDTAKDPFKRYIYKGPYTYEFIGGDWGVDEEILDGYDNDLDGLVDEDGRITADTLDDDGDWYDTRKSMNAYEAISAINNNGKTYHPMVWDSIYDGFDSLHIKIIGTFDQIVIKPNYTLIHKTLNNPRTGKPDYPITYRRYNPDNGSIYTVGTLSWPATGTIPIFKGDTTAGQTEFTYGDYGLDEEYYDGIDNDGDGLVDEDVGERNPPESVRRSIINKLIDLGLSRDYLLK